MGGAIISESGGGIIPLQGGGIIPELGGGFLRNQQNAAELIVTVLAAIELSKITWLLAIHDPTSNKVSRRRCDGGDVEGLIGILQRCRRAVQADSGVGVAIECVFEAGYDGFWLQRRLAQAGIACSRYGSGKSQSGPESASGQNGPGRRRKPLAGSPSLEAR